MDGNPFPSFDNVLIVEGFKHYLLIISLLSDNGYKVYFKKHIYIVKRSDDILICKNMLKYKNGGLNCILKPFKIFS